MSKEQSTILKGVAILMMLWYHLFNRVEINDLCTPIIMIGNTPLVVYISNACYPVTFFLILSGYGFTYLYQQRRLSIKGQIKKISKIYFNYWLVLIIFIRITNYLLHHSWFIFFARNHFVYCDRKKNTI